MHMSNMMFTISGDFRYSFLNVCVLTHQIGMSKIIKVENVGFIT